MRCAALQDKPTKPLFAAPSDVQPRMELHCIDPWYIGRAEPRREAIAKTYLEREGFEVWYPKGRSIRKTPLRMISSKTRHKHKEKLIEDVRTVYPGYLFIRRLFAVRPLWRIYEIEGVLGLCTFGDQLATIPDFRIEMLRMSEVAGDFDCYAPGVTPRMAYVSERKQTKAAEDMWTNEPRKLGSVDIAGKSLQFVEEFGRVTRIIKSHDDWLAGQGATPSA